MSEMMAYNKQKAELFEAIQKAQVDCKNPPLDGYNPHFKSNFATLKAVRESVLPKFLAHGMAVVQGVEERDNGKCVLVTTVAHKNGLTWLVSTIPLPSGDMQKLGSAITYARRYALLSLGNVVGDPDDDGNEASEPEPEIQCITKEQRQELYDLIDATGANVAKLCEYYDVNDVLELTIHSAEHAIGALRSKLDKKNEAENGEGAA